MESAKADNGKAKDKDNGNGKGKGDGKNKGRSISQAELYEAGLLGIAQERQGKDGEPEVYVTVYGSEYLVKRAPKAKANGNGDAREDPRKYFSEDLLMEAGYGGPDLHRRDFGLPHA
ncbi:MAG: hypothetical protein H5T34_01570 [Candidatus Methanomethyliales bacterium]|nr:hypothetical protein [Candidatus Methanomethylicales archaeon]